MKTQASFSPLGTDMPHRDSFRTSSSTRRKSSLLEIMSGSENFHSQFTPEEEESLTLQYKHDDTQRVKLDWKTGVLIPCMLSIFGPMMFLRLGMVVGHAGLLFATVIITLANVITLITTLSLSAICTNGDVKAGGAYFTISRSLGPSTGGVIGVLLYVAQTVSVSMYVVGFSEVIVNLYDTGINNRFFTGAEIGDMRVISVITMMLLLLVARIGVSWYAKAQTGLLAILVIAIAAVFFGSFNVGNLSDDEAHDLSELEENAQSGFVGYSFLWDNGGSKARNEFLGRLGLLDPSEYSIWLEDWSVDTVQNFGTVFAIFFPAVTGANMSGDLVNPSQDIPRGTLSAIGITYTTYIVLAFVVGLSCVRCINGVIGDVTGLCPTSGATTAWLVKAKAEERIPIGGLLYNKLIMKDIALWGPLIYLGAGAATLSSALSSLVGAPRILQSLAADEIFPWRIISFFGEGEGPQQEPTRGYYLTFVIATSFALIGKLDLLAGGTTCVVLSIYAVINYACFAASDVRAPSWRPSFRYYDKHLAAFGSILCFTLMFALQWSYALLTFFVAAILFRYLENRRFKAENSRTMVKTWGVAGEAQRYTSALRAQWELQRVPPHSKNFRPQLLVLAGEAGQRPWLVKLSHMICEKGGGMLLFGQIATFKELNEEKTNPSSPILSDTDFVIDMTAGKDKESTSAQATSRGFSDRNIKSFQKNSRTDLANINLRASHYAAKLRRQQYKFFYDNNDVWLNGAIPGGVFCDVVVIDREVSSKSFHDAFLQLLNLSGLGKLRPNTIVLGFKKDCWKQKKYTGNSCDSPSRDEYVQMIHDSILFGWGVVIVRDDDFTLDVDMKSVSSIPSWATWALGSRTMIHAAKGLKKGEAYIDIWWLSDDGGLTMLIPYLLQQSYEWQTHTLRVWVLAETESEQKNTTNIEGKGCVKKEKMENLLKSLRIEGTVKSIPFDAVKPLSKKSIDTYKKLGIFDVAFQQTDIEHPTDTPDLAKDANNANALRLLQLAEALRTYSSDSTIIFATLPLPLPTMGNAQYMALLECLTGCRSSHCGFVQPPTVLIHGSEQCLSASA